MAPFTSGTRIILEARRPIADATQSLREATDNQRTRGSAHRNDDLPQLNFQLLILAIEDEVGDGEQGAAVFGIGQFFEANFRATHIFSRQIAARSSAPVSCTSLVICSGARSRNPAPPEPSPPAAGLRVRWPFRAIGPLSSIRLQREDQRQRDFAFFQIAEHRLAQLVRAKQ